MAKKTKQIRILTEGEFNKLKEKIFQQFKIRHGIEMSDDQICETIAKAIEEEKLFR